MGYPTFIISDFRENYTDSQVNVHIFYPVHRWMSNVFRCFIVFTGFNNFLRFDFGHNDEFQKMPVKKCSHRTDETEYAGKIYINIVWRVEGGVS